MKTSLAHYFRSPAILASRQTITLCLLTLSPALAHAQSGDAARNTVASDNDEATGTKDIIVTGTSIRGAAPSARN
jgi:hypothetical protein